MSLRVSSVFKSAACRSFRFAHICFSCTSRALYFASCSLSSGFSLRRSLATIESCTWWSSPKCCLYSSISCLFSATLRRSSSSSVLKVFPSCFKPGSFSWRCKRSSCSRACSAAGWFTVFSLPALASSTKGLGAGGWDCKRTLSAAAAVASFACSCFCKLCA